MFLDFVIGLLKLALVGCGITAFVLLYMLFVEGLYCKRACHPAQGIMIQDECCCATSSGCELLNDRSPPKEGA